MADIFLSYSRVDRARVLPLVEGLQARGWSVWWDRDIAPGRGFEEEIDREISAAECVLVVWSNNSVNSRWVRNEALEGLERNILVPVLLDDVRIPVAFRQSQAVDFRLGIDTRAQPWDALVNAVRGFTGGDTAPCGVTAPPQSIERPTIAVLPFQTASGDVECQFLIQALVIEISGRLAHIPGFFVISAATTMNYAGTDHSPVKIGRELGLRYVVDGNIQGYSNKLRIHARLTDVLSGKQLWSQRLDASGELLPDVEDEIVHNMLASIEPALARSELARIARYRPADMDAWTLCQQGLALLQVKGWHESVLRQSVSVLEQSARKDPDFALPVAAKSVMLGVGQRLAFWIDDPVDYKEQSLEAAARAIEMADGDSQALGYAGCALADWGNTEESFPVLDLAIENDPSNAQAYMARSLAWRDIGEIDRAVEDGAMALRLSPRDASQAAWMMAHAAALLQSGNVADAHSCARLSVQRDPRYFGSRVILALVHLAREEGGLAARAIADAKRLRPELTLRQLEGLVGESTVRAMAGHGLLGALDS
jgi:adenylate cyclase